MSVDTPGREAQEQASPDRKRAVLTRRFVPVPASQARPPRTTWDVVERRHLLRRISRCVEDHPLTLLCAPAGSGKTLLAADWARRRGKNRPVAWVTVTERDEQPGVFWAHLRLALALVGVLASEALHPMFPDSADVDALSEELLQLMLPVVLVVDAADRLHGRAVFDQLARLMDNAGDRVRVLITTRTDPALPLHRYRVEGTVAEIRTDELALTRTEVGKVLGQHRLAPTDELTEEVMRRTEGWAAGVRLAALRLRSRDDASLDGFASDYLREEVLEGLAPEERELLARISVVEELPPGLAAFLTDRSDADALVRDLAAANAFVQATSGQPDVFRVHPLVRELVGAELEEAAPDAPAALHRRAATWYGGAGQLERAVRHAAAADDWEQAARLVVDGQGLGELIAGTTTGTALVEHLDPIPERDIADVRLVRAAIAVGEGELEQARIELAHSSATEPDDRRMLAAAVLETALHDAASRPDETLEAALHARSQLTTVGDETGPDLLRAAVVSAEGAAQLRVGDLEAACSALNDALRAVGDADGPLRLRCLADLSLAEACRGHLSRAIRLADAAERLAAEQDLPAAERPAASDLARAWVALERQNLPQAQRSLDHGVRVRRADAESWGALTTLIRARLMRDRGESTSARRLLQQADPPTGWLRDHVAAEAAAVGVPDRAGEMRPGDGSPLPAALPAEPSIAGQHRVAALLERADERCRAGRDSAARVDVARALTMAQTERLRRPFAHTSPRILAMVRNDPTLYTKAGWLRPEQLGGPAQGSPAGTDPDPVRESLSGRELEVLRHLSALLTTDEIAAEMFISVNTVRTHVRRILEKLAVSRRNEAVRRGRELGLV